MNAPEPTARELRDAYAAAIALAETVQLAGCRACSDADEGLYEARAMAGALEDRLGRLVDDLELRQAA